MLLLFTSSVVKVAPVRHSQTLNTAGTETEKHEVQFEFLSHFNALVGLLFCKILPFVSSMQEIVSVSMQTSLTSFHLETNTGEITSHHKVYLMAALEL